MSKVVPGPSLTSGALHQHNCRNHHHDNTQLGRLIAVRLHPVISVQLSARYCCMLVAVLVHRCGRRRVCAVLQRPASVTVGCTLLSGTAECRDRRSHRGRVPCTVLKRPASDDHPWQGEGWHTQGVTTQVVQPCTARAPHCAFEQAYDGASTVPQGQVVHLPPMHI